MDGDGGHRHNEDAAFYHRGLFSKLLNNHSDDRIQHSPLCDIGALLKGWGLPPTHLSVALLITLGFNSARLGHPIHLALTEEEGAGAGELLNLCRRLAPADGILEFIDIPDVSRYSLGGKAILLPGYEGKNKKLAGLVSLLQYGTVPHSNLTKMKNAGDVTEGPTALICFVRDKNSEILTVPFIFHLHLPSPNISNIQRALQEESLTDCNSFGSDLNYLHMKALLFRLRSQEVTIPFFPLIASSINDTIHNNLEVIRFVKKVIKLVTLINNFEPASKRGDHSHLFGRYSW